MQRGLHVTRLFLSSLPLSSRFPLRMVKRTSVPLQFFLHTTPSFSQRKLGDESRGSIAIGPFQLGPPTRRELPPEAHPLCSTQLEREEVYNNRLIASERLSQLSNGITRALTPSIDSDPGASGTTRRRTHTGFWKPCTVRYVASFILCVFTVGTRCGPGQAQKARRFFDALLKDAFTRPYPQASGGI